MHKPKIIDEQECFCYTCGRPESHTRVERYKTIKLWACGGCGKLREITPREVKTDTEAR